MKNFFIAANSAKIEPSETYHSEYRLSWAKIPEQTIKYIGEPHPSLKIQDTEKFVIDAIGYEFNNRQDGYKISNYTLIKETDFYTREESLNETLWQDKVTPTARRNSFIINSFISAFFIIASSILLYLFKDSIHVNEKIISILQGVAAFVAIGLGVLAVLFLIWGITKISKIEDLKSPKINALVQRYDLFDKPDHSLTINIQESEKLTTQKLNESKVEIVALETIMRVIPFLTAIIGLTTLFFVFFSFNLTFIISWAVGTLFTMLLYPFALAEVLSIYSVALTLSIDSDNRKKNA